MFKLNRSMKRTGICAGNYLEPPTESDVTSKGPSSAWRQGQAEHTLCGRVNRTLQFRTQQQGPEQPWKHATFHRELIT